MKKYTVIAACLLSMFSVYSQETWTLRDCIDFAIDHNIQVEQQNIQVKQAETNLSTSKNSRLPDLNANIGSGFNFGRSTSIASNEYKSVNSANSRLEVSTSMPLFTGFKIPNDIKAKEFDLRAATEGLNKAKENLELQITSYYLDVLFKKELLKINKEQVELTKQEQAKTKILVESGKVAMSQLYDIASQLAKNELDVTNAENDLNLSLLNLSQALNLRWSDKFNVVEPDVNDFSVTPNVLSSLRDPEDIYQIALNIKPHIKEAIYQIESSRKNLKVAQSAYWPSLDMSLGYNTALQRVYNMSNPSFSDQIKNNRSEYISFNLSIPIFNRLQTRNNVRKARLEIQDREYNLTSVKLDLYKEIQQAYQNAVAAVAKFNSTQKAYEAASESFHYAEERYQVGKISVFEYSEAQTKLITSRSEQIQAKYDFIFRSKILDFYQGKAIDI